MLEMVNGAPPLFVSVIVCAALVVPTGWLANVRLAGDRLTAEAVPMPVKLTACGLPIASSLIVIAPRRMSVVVGLNVTLIAQPAPAARVAGDSGQVFV